MTNDPRSAAAITPALDLEPIKAREAVATSADLRLMRYDHGGGRLARFTPRPEPHYRGEDERQLIADFFDEANREFYYYARTDIPALVAEIERLRAALLSSDRAVQLVKLARQAADYNHHKHFEMHSSGDDHNPHYAECQHPDCVLVRMALPFSHEREWIARFNKLPEIVHRAEERAALLSSDRAVHPEIADRICPFCGDPIRVLKPSGGCLTADINGYVCHPICADAFETFKAAASDRAVQPEGNEAMDETPDVVKVIGACPRCGGLPGPFIREAHQRLDELGIPRNNSGGYFLSLVQRINLLYNECETATALLKERSHETR